ncbi:phospholipase/carboxylesterase family protein-like protein [Lentithecium fluviatile CBS 122367]|uniref:Phospholipase/carboxylesterase family protein-like protein n=1 Tax=Lentithecium fluviatile CBS 122367 TaxID=1168545 RepID=A0A6G1J165_9PLEO|nr:phospholipase/carboxylesterase family protein-like protein [Lentithecium fluviatile CBS 122367]
MSSSTSKPPANSPPLIVPPLQNHKTTLIILHSRGSTAHKFAEPLLTHLASPLSRATTQRPNSPAGSPKSFRYHFPNTRFVFLTAPLRRAVVLKRSLTHQWFDNWSLIQPELKQHLQVPGLRETSAFLHDLLNKEIEVVGADNVVLMGLCQGCAASIVAALLWEGEAFGALVGMWDTGKAGDDSLVEPGDDGEDIFERDCEGSGGGTKFERAWIPVFMGHGTEDDKVPCDIGRLAAEFLRGIDMNVDWKEFEGLGHWYSEDMLRDVIRFIKGLNGWEDSYITKN